MGISGRFRGSSRLLLVASTVILAAGVVACAPFFLVEVASVPLPWSRLGDVGDAYGGASALLSAAALCGIGISLIYQQKQLKQELIGIDRQRHHDPMPFR